VQFSFVSAFRRYESVGLKLWSTQSATKPPFDKKKKNTLLSETLYTVCLQKH